MINRLRLERFKGFREAKLELGPFTVLVGSNATGKSNVRDAFRLLHGIAHHHTLSEILGELRGGSREASYRQGKSFALELDLTVDSEGEKRQANYRLEIDPGQHAQEVPRLVAERLSLAGSRYHGYDSLGENGEPVGGDSDTLDVCVRPEGPGPASIERFRRDKPVLGQIAAEAFGLVSFEPTSRRQNWLGLLIPAIPVFTALRGQRFFDLDPESMRQPSAPGQAILNDNGGNLSSVLQHLCLDENRKRAILEWTRSLTPMDILDFQFVPDPSGKVLAMLRERDGTLVSVYSASDGTLRFLAMISALVGPPEEAFYFFEELENGIHPRRLSLMTQLIEQQVRDRNVQVVGTTHAPTILALLSREAQDYVSLTYRLEGSAEADICRIMDIPDARQVLEQQDLGRLHELGWLEDVVEFTTNREVA